MEDAKLRPVEKVIVARTKGCKEFPTFISVLLCTHLLRHTVFRAKWQRLVQQFH